MSLKKKELKKLKQPDVFQKEMFQIGDWAAKNKKVLINITIPILIIVAAFVSWQEYNEVKGENRRVALAKIDKIYDDENKAADDKRSELRTKIAEISKKENEAKAPKIEDKKDAKKAEAKKEPAKKVDLAKLAVEKKAIEDSIKKIEADHSNSLAKYQDFYKSHRKTPEGWRSALKSTTIFIEQKKFKEAEAAISPVMATSKGYNFYQTQVRLLYISLLEENEKFDDALKEVETLLTVVSEGMKPKALLAKGRIELLKNQKEKAYATFDSLITKFETSPEARKAKTIKGLWN